MADLSRRSAQPNGGSQPSLQRGSGGLFSDLLGWDPLRNLMSSAWQTAGVEIERKETGYRLDIPVPGFSPDQIDITFQDGVVLISGKTDRRSVQRSIILPEDIDADKIEARVAHGMLTLELPTVPQAQPRRIQIQGGSTKGRPSTGETFDGGQQVVQQGQTAGQSVSHSTRDDSAK